MAKERDGLKNGLSGPWRGTVPEKRSGRNLFGISRLLGCEEGDLNPEHYFRRSESHSIDSPADREVRDLRVPFRPSLPSISPQKPEPFRSWSRTGVRRSGA